MLVGDTKSVVGEPCWLGKIVLSPCVKDVDDDTKESAFIIYCYDVADEPCFFPKRLKNCFQLLDCVGLCLVSVVADASEYVCHLILLSCLNV